MKKIKKIISKIITATMMVNILPINCFALDDKDIPITISTHVGNSGLGNSSVVNGVTIAPFTLDGDVAYCMNALKDFPVMHNYTAAGSYDSDSFLRAIAYYGYGANKTGLKEKHSLTDEEARAFTQFAIWDYIEKGYFANKSYPYLDELRSLAKNTGVPSIEFDISKTSPTISDSGSLQTSEVITTSSNYKGTITFPSDANVYSVNTSGTKQNTFNIGESFKIVGVDSVNGTLTKNITVNIQDVTLLKFIPNDSRYQDFGVPSTKTTTIYKQMTLNFKNPISYGAVTVNKADDSGAALQGVEFGVYSDSLANTLVEKKTTGADGRVTFSNLVVGNTYYVKEIAPITGYVMDNSIKDVTIDATTKELSFVNTKIKGQIKIIKTEEGRDDIKLKGAEFQILDVNDGVVDTIITGDDGTAISKVLPYGSYKVKESKAPNGYNLSSKIVNVDIAEHNKVYEVSYGNNFIKGNIEIIKKDSEDGSRLQGVKFGVYKTQDSSLVEEITTDSNGVAKSSDLRYGEYFIKEIEAKVGYALDSSTYNVTISENLKTYPKEILNEKIKGEFVINKVDAESGNALKDVEFLVKCTNGFDAGKEWSLTTNENGMATINGLKYGEYSVVETKTQEGYILKEEPVDFKIDSNNQSVKIDFKNHKIKGDLNINKVDSEDGKPLSGVEFVVECIDGFDLGAKVTLVTGEDGSAKIDNLNYGKYTIKEEKTKEGYVLKDDITEFKITENGEYIDIEITNDKIYGVLNFYKVDKDTEETIGGAVISVEGISEFNKDVVFSFESSEDGNVFELPYGEYNVRETKAPEGYVLSDDVVDFKISVNMEVVDVLLENEKIKGTIIINKLAEGSKKPLEGAVFGVYDSDKNLIEEIKTDSNGIAKLENISFGKYYYSEIKAPEGYLVDLNMYEFSIVEDGEIVEKTVYNKLLNPYPDRTDEINENDKNVLNPLPDTSGSKQILIVYLVMLVIGSYLILNKRR